MPNFTQNNQNDVFKKLILSPSIKTPNSFPVFSLITSEDVVQFNQLDYNFIFSKYGLLQAHGTSLSVLSTFFFLKNLSNNSLYFLNDENCVLMNENEFFKNYEFIKNFKHLRKSSFIDFFLNNFIDIPICFKKTKSIKRKNFEFFFLKFINLLMRKGKKEKTFRAVLTALDNFFYKNFGKLLIKNSDIFWFDLFFIFNFTNKMKNENQWAEASPFEQKSTHFAYTVNENFKEMNPNFFLKNFIYSRITQFSPIFSYFIYNVDKNIRKFTRGKSGKYVFVWKYVAPYKRSYLVYRWFLKELKFDDSRNFNQRLNNLFHVLTYDLKQTYAWKSKNYTYAFIFKNFRKSLMLHLKTIVL